MVGVSKLLTNEIISLAESSLKKATNYKIILKLHAIISAKRHGIKRAAELHKVDISTLNRWIRRLRDESLEGLKHKPKKPRNPFTIDQQETIKTWLINDSNMTLATLRIKIEKDLGIKAGQTAVYGILQKLGFVYRAKYSKKYKKSYWTQRKK